MIIIHVSNQLTEWIDFRVNWKLVLWMSPWAQDVNWTYIRRSEDAMDIFWTSYVRSIYVLCPGGWMQIIWNRECFTWNISDYDYRYESTILSLHGKIRIRKNAYSDVFHAVSIFLLIKDKSSRSQMFLKIGRCS